MPIVIFLVELMGALMLLLYAVRMVRTGIERSFGQLFREALTADRGRSGYAALGLGLAVVLQSSAAVALLASSFASAGYVGFTAGVALILGADLGSALVIQILSFDLSLLVPLLLASGGWLAVKTKQRGPKQAGRILMGIALILISLQLLRAAVEPIRDGEFLPLVAGYLEADRLTAFLVGAGLAFIMHSSVAAILVVVTLVQIGSLPLLAGLALVLGANLGSGLIAVWLTRDMPPVGASLPMTNLIVRGGLAILMLPALPVLAEVFAGWISAPGQTLVFAHIAFNAVLMVLVLPCIAPLEPLVTRLMSALGKDKDRTELPNAARALANVTDLSPTNAIACLRRELLRMSEQVERMFLPVLDLYTTNEPELNAAVREIEDDVDAALEAVRKFVAGLPLDTYPDRDVEVIRGLMDYAIRLESAGDVVVTVFFRLAKGMHEENAQFSEEGWAEIQGLRDAIVKNLAMANTVLVSEDVECARILVEEKASIKRGERESRKRHMDRLNSGNTATLESSNVHLETIRAMRDFNSHISAVAYATLHREGQLLETKLISSQPA